jgi:hypothetical protein
MRCISTWLGHGFRAMCCVAVLLGLAWDAIAAKPRHEEARLGKDVSRMVFKEGKKSKQEQSCKLTMMHVYTSKFNKKSTQFAFTGSLVAKREKGKDLVLTLGGQNYELSSVGKDFKPFMLSRIELGVEDASVRRFVDHRQKCKKGHVCAEYKDNKKHELQAWVSDDQKNLSLLFPLMAKQPPVVIDLSKFAPSEKETQRPLALFKACTASLH